MTTLQSTALNTAGRFAHIDALRAFAVMLVVIAHAGLGAVVPGGSGVTIFFTVSGFVITYLLLKEQTKTGGFRVGAFYWRRFLKIFPPLLTVVVAPSLVLLVLNDSISIEGLLSQAFFVFNWVYLASDRQIAVLPGSDVVWSLSIEEQFYIVFALVWIALVRSQRGRSVLLVLAISVVAYANIARLLLAADSDAGSRIYYGTDTRIDGIAIGVILALLLASPATNQHWTSRLLAALGRDWVLLAALGVYVLSLVIRDEYFRDTLRFTLQSLAAAAVIAYGFMAKPSGLSKFFLALSTSRIVSILGLASYSIYLAHLTAMEMLRPWLTPLPAIVAIPLYALAGTSAGLLVYYLVERPVLWWRKRKATATLPRLESSGRDTGI